jgi:hypothetical protein
LKTTNLQIHQKKPEMPCLTYHISDSSKASGTQFSRSIAHDNIYRLCQKEHIRLHNGCARVCRRCPTCWFISSTYNQNSTYGTRIPMKLYAVEDLQEHYQLAQFDERGVKIVDFIKGGKKYSPCPLSLQLKSDDHQNVTHCVRC